MKKYVQTCDICQRIQISRYQLYEQFNFLSIFKKIWIFFMNFITNLSTSKRRDNVYDVILMIIDRFIKISKYISMIKIIDVAKLTNVFFEKIMLRYDMSNDIINDKNNVFTNVFWSSLCFHAKIRKRLNNAFHFQTNESIERQN